MNMKTIKVSEAIDQVLDYLVAKCEGIVPSDAFAIYSTWQPPCYSTNWAQGGPIKERCGISTRFNHKQANVWEAYIWTPTQHDITELDSNSHTSAGSTELVAAMRCRVVSKLGETAEVPEELV